jgi:hypothetical protein
MQYLNTAAHHAFVREVNLSTVLRLIHTEVTLLEFGPDASLLGTAAIVVDKIFASPAHIERR